jgi:hypothetical protein
LPDLENRAVPKFTMPTPPAIAREIRTPGGTEVVTAKHSWSVENKTPPPASSQPPSEIVRTAFSDQAAVTPAEPVDEFDPAFFNQQTKKEVGPGH